MVKTLFLFALTAFAAFGGQLTIVSYDMPNGTAGGANYLDTSYSGSGNPSGSGSSLSGGTGKLTDGYVPGNFYGDFNTWVGWQNSAVTVDLNFSGVQSFGTLRLYLQKGPTAGISLPSSVGVVGSQAGSATFTGFDTTVDSAAWFDFNVSGFSGDKLSFTMTKSDTWMFLGEVQVLDGSVPEPASGALVVLAAGLGVTVRRRLRARA